MPSRRRIASDLVLLSCLLIAVGCARHESAVDKPPARKESEAQFVNVHLDNTNDLVCGMSLAAGVGDTALYAGKVYGFCSKGCKEKFVANPSQFLVASGG